MHPNSSKLSSVPQPRSSKNPLGRHTLKDACNCLVGFFVVVVVPFARFFLEGDLRWIFHNCHGFKKNKTPRFTSSQLPSFPSLFRMFHSLSCGSNSPFTPLWFWYPIHWPGTFHLLLMGHNPSVMSSYLPVCMVFRYRSPFPARLYGFPFPVRHQFPVVAISVAPISSGPADSLVPKFPISQVLHGFGQQFWSFLYNRLIHASFSGVRFVRKTFFLRHPNLQLSL